MKLFVFLLCLISGSLAFASDLYRAIDNGNEEEVRKLLDAGISANAPSDFDGNPLHYIAMRIGMNMNIAKLLVERGSNVNLRDRSAYEYTPLHYATKKKLVEILVEGGADVNALSLAKNTPLHHAAGNARKETVMFLLAKGADVNARNQNSSTPLHQAAHAWDKDVVEILLMNKAEVNAAENDGDTPLHRAAAEDRIDSIVLL